MNPISQSYVPKGFSKHTSALDALGVSDALDAIECNQAQSSTIKHNQAQSSAIKHNQAQSSAAERNRRSECTIVLKIAGVECRIRNEFNFHYRAEGQCGDLERGSCRFMLRKILAVDLVHRRKIRDVL